MWGTAWNSPDLEKKNMYFKLTNTFHFFLFSFSFFDGYTIQWEGLAIWKTIIVLSIWSPARQQPYKPYVIHQESFDWFLIWRLNHRQFPQALFCRIPCSGELLAYPRGPTGVEVDVRLRWKYEGRLNICRNEPMICSIWRANFRKM